MRTVTAVLMALAVVLAASGVGWADDSKPAAAAPQALVNLELQNTSVVDGIKALFRGRGISCRIEPGVSGKIVELTLKGVTFEQALKAFTDAAELKYTVDQDGVYVISPSKTGATGGTTQRTAMYEQSGAQPGAQQPEAALPEQQPTGEQPVAMQPQQPAPPAQVGPGVQVLVGQQAPVFYGTPGGSINLIDNGGYYPPYGYQIGNISVLDGGFPPITIGGYNPYILNINGQHNLPPPGWVSPEMERLLRAQYVFQPPPPFFITPYY